MLEPRTLLSSTAGVSSGFRFESDQILSGDAVAAAQVSAAGDFNGDGLRDVLFSRPQMLTEGRDSDGDLVLLQGSPSGVIKQMTDSNLDGVHGLRIVPPNGIHRFAVSAAGVGDVNADGFDDLIVAASGRVAVLAAPYDNVPVPAPLSASHAWIIFGRSEATHGTIDLNDLSAAGAVQLSAHPVGGLENVFWSVAKAGDVNADGLPDVVIGTVEPESRTPTAFVLFGRRGSWDSTMELSTLSAEHGIRVIGLPSDTQMGNREPRVESLIRVNTAGDFNADGRADIVIGLPYDDPNGLIDAGTVMVISGQSLSSGTTCDASTLDGSSGFRVHGIAGYYEYKSGEQNYYESMGLHVVRGYQIGSWVGSAGDLDGDGHSEVGYGTPYFVDESLPGSFSGYSRNRSLGNESVVMFGASTFERRTYDLKNPSDREASNRASFGIYFSGTISPTGDLDGDGRDDVLVGSQIVSQQPPTPYVASQVKSVIKLHGGSTSSVDVGDMDGDGIRELAYVDELFRSGPTTPTLTVLSANQLAGRSVSIDQPGAGRTLLMKTNTANTQHVGRTVSNAGDVNGDGFDDLLIGLGVIPEWRRGSFTERSAGQCYVVFGGPSLPESIDLGSLGSNGITIIGSDLQDGRGWSISGAGDLNADGLADIVIGAAGTDSEAGADSGTVFVIFGRRSFPELMDLSVANTADLVITGADADSGSGYSVSDAGDVNGDGFDDLLIGDYHKNSGASDAIGVAAGYLIFGGASLPRTMNLGQLESRGLTFTDSLTRWSSGFSLSNAGDVNGDGFADVLVAQPINRSSNSYLVYGGVALGAMFDLRLPGIGGNTLVSDGHGQEFASSAGDIDGDGFDDVLIGSPDSYAGVTRVIHGAAVGVGDVRTKVVGVARYNASGTSISSAGDVNGDGLDDVVIGAPRAGEPGYYSGESYLLFGRPTQPKVIDLEKLGTGGVVVTSDGFHRFNGVSVSAAGDVNGDGFDDFLTGSAGGLDDSYHDLGQTALFFGGDLNGTTSKAGSESSDTLAGDATANVMVGGLGNDTLVGNGGADVLRGGHGDDVLSISDVTFRKLVGGSGRDTVKIDGDGILFDLTAVPDNRIKSIEQIDLGARHNVLVVGLRDIVNLSGESNTVTVRGGLGDRVVIDEGWMRGTTETSEDVTFEILKNGAATLRIQSGIVLGATVAVFTLHTNQSFSVTSTDGNVTAHVSGGVDQFFDLAAKDLLTLLVIGGDGGNVIDLSRVTAAEFPRLRTIHVFGNAGDDLITGSQFNDVLEGGLGQDTLLGGFGDDFVQGDADQDVLRGGEGRDTLLGGDGHDSLVGGSGNDRLVGDAGNDTLEGCDAALTAESITSAVVESDRDRLFGGPGNDWLLAMVGADTLNGGPGHDRLEVRTVRMPGLARSVGTLRGDSGNDTLLGGSLADWLEGGNGADVLGGGAGADTLWGGDGADHLSGEAGQDSLDGGAGPDTLWGGGHDDLLRGNTGNDSLVGGSGDDHLWGDDGADTLVGSVGADVLNGYGGSGFGRDRDTDHDQLFGGSGADTLFGGFGDWLMGQAGNDVLSGAAGNNTLDGGLGTDRLSVSYGGGVLTNHRLSGVVNADLLSLEEAWLTLSYGSHLLDASAWSGRVTLEGTNYADTLIGGSNDDVLIGGAGNDLLVGGQGIDTLDGGLGTNRDDNDPLDRRLDAVVEEGSSPNLR